MERATQTRSDGERGQSLLETALMIVVIFTVAFWTIETGELVYTYSVLADAANEGVRYAIVHSGGDVTNTQATVLAFAKASKHNVSGITTSVTFPDGSATPPNRVRVAVTYAYVPTLGSFSPSMKTYAEGRMVVQ
jgi:Flp pilus assembly protein TadG